MSVNRRILIITCTLGKTWRALYDIIRQKVPPEDVSKSLNP